MKLRALVATLTTVVSVFAAGILAAPAHAETLVEHDDSYAPYVAGTQGAANPVVAMNASGDRAFGVFMPPGQEGCDPGATGIFVRGGSVNSLTTSWSSNAAQAEVLPGLDCGSPLHLTVSMSDDGTLGMLAWLAYAPISGDWVMRVARISWPLNEATPTVTDNLWADEFASGGEWPRFDVAMSADGSRAVVAWRLDDGGTVSMKYAVIDLADVSSTHTQQLPDTYTEVVRVSDVAISDDGSIVALSAVATPDLTTGPDTDFRAAKVFVCSHNCYSSRLKTYTASASAGKGPVNGATLTMSREGSVIGLAWADGTWATSMVAFAPTVRGAAVNISSKVKYLPNVSIGDGSHAVMNDAGTRMSVTCERNMCGEAGAVTMVTATISSAQKIGAVSVTPVLPTHIVSFTEVADVRYLDKSGSAPERLAMLATTSPLGSDTQTVELLVANDAAVPRYWSTVAMRVSEPDAWFADPSFAMSASGARYVLGSQEIGFNGVDYVYDSRVIVGDTKVTAGVKTLPTISGSLKVGKVLTASKGVFTTLPASATFTYEWFRDGESVSTGRTYALTQADAGTTLSVLVTATSDTSYPIAVSSAETATVTGGVLTVSTVTITGSAVDGGELQAETSGSSTAGVSVSYTWKRGTRVVGELSGYTPTNLDVGKRLTLIARFYKNGFTDKKVTVTSAVVAGAAD